MSLLHSRRFSSWARGHLLCRFEGVDDRFALTFDDGPNGDMTPALLDLLRDRGDHATFFVLAPNVHRHPALVRRMVREGHEVAVHGDLHWPLALLPPWALRREVQGTIAALESATHVRPHYYRPPFGFMMPGQAAYVRTFGLECVLGDVYPEDPPQPPAVTIAHRVLARLRGGSIVILHDGSPFGDCDRAQTLAATARILTEAHGRGLRAVTLSQLAATAGLRAATAAATTH